MRSAQIFPFVIGALLVACGPSKRGEDDDGIPDAPPADAPCPTTISGKVFAPNGTLPLYNVTVYVPQNPPGPFTDGVSCSQCTAQLPGGAWAQAKSDAEGKFVLDGVPPGTDVPIVITTGKWRRQLTIPYVAKCVDTPVMDGYLRLPRNRTEGDMPRIAMVTGLCDSLACIFKKMGIDASEFGSSSAGPQRITFYNGDGGSAPGTPAAAPTALWNNLDELKKFDMVINSCECSEMNTNKTSPDVMRQYADLGGRVFGSHFHYTWMKNLIPQWQGVASFNLSGTSSSAPVLIDTSHPDGQSFAKWAMAAGASTSMGVLNLTGYPQPSEAGVIAPTTRWLYASGANPVTHYMSFKTPVGVPMDQQCGKVVHADLHVSEDSSVDATFPAGCTAQLSPDEKAMVFLLFDLGSCVDIIF
jgi:hypothetical protein